MDIAYRAGRLGCGIVGNVEMVEDLLGLEIPQGTGTGI